MISNYLNFVLRIEFVFVKLLTKNNLVVIGNTLISKIYDEIIAHNFARREILTIIIDVFYFETMNTLICFMVRTYYRMRGKYFVRNLTMTNFKNLTKVVRPYMVVFADGDIRGARKKEDEMG